MAESREAGPSCFKCKYLKITWDPARPYACLAMSFKSRQIPSLVVRRESGKPCMAFSLKSHLLRKQRQAPAGRGRGNKA